MYKDPLRMKVTNGQGNVIKGVMKSWDENHLNVDHLIQNNWVVYFKK